MNQRIANKYLKDKRAVLWMYHWLSDAHIEGHNWLHGFQYRMILKCAKRIKFRQIRHSKHYNETERVGLCCPIVKHK